MHYPISLSLLRLFPFATLRETSSLAFTRLRYMVVGRNNSVALLITCGDCAAFVFSFWKGDDGKRLGPGIQNHAAVAIVFHGSGFDHKMGKEHLICKR